MATPQELMDEINRYQTQVLNYTIIGFMLGFSLGVVAGLLMVRFLFE